VANAAARPRFLGVSPASAPLSRAHRDRVNAAVMQDPAMQDPAMMGAMPFDTKRFAVAGFEELVGW